MHTGIVENCMKEDCASLVINMWICVIDWHEKAGKIEHISEIKRKSVLTRSIDHASPPPSPIGLSKHSLLTESVLWRTYVCTLFITPSSPKVERGTCASLSCVIFVGAYTRGDRALFRACECAGCWSFDGLVTCYSLCRGGAADIWDVKRTNTSHIFRVVQTTSKVGFGDFHSEYGRARVPRWLVTSQNEKQTDNTCSSYEWTWGFTKASLIWELCFMAFWWLEQDSSLERNKRFWSNLDLNEEYQLVLRSGMEKSQALK